MRFRTSCAVVILAAASTGCNTGGTVKQNPDYGPVDCVNAVPNFKFGPNTVPMDEQPHAYTCLQYPLGDGWYLQLIKGPHGKTCMTPGAGCDKHAIRMCKPDGGEAPCPVGEGESAMTGPNGCKVCASAYETEHLLLDPNL